MRQDARRLHANAIVVDCHCDTLSFLAEKGGSFEAGTKGQVDLPRLKRGGVNIQFFAVFVSPQYRGAYLRRALEQVDIFAQITSICSEKLVSVCNPSGLDAALAEGKIAGVLAIEGGHVVEGSIGVLRAFYRVGVRCLTLTWNCRNELADGVAENESGGGLTSFGREVVREMERLGMMIDVAHLAPAGFWDVLRLAQGPVIASHANSRRLCGHPRNLTDDQVRELAGGGGVIGVSFVPEFIDPVRPTLDRLVDHIEHLAAVGGSGCVGIGSDFDGAPRMVTGLEDAACLPLLTERLVGRGWQEADIRKVLGENFLRVMKEVWK
ncbi:MAG TPA: membrane dipeptidase [Desulfotomaculum sp.]|nr:membrane dipeptidase [Desulfotomaculum sp.]